MDAVKFGASSLDTWVFTQENSTGFACMKSLSGSYSTKEELFLAVLEAASEQR